MSPDMARIKKIISGDGKELNEYARELGEQLQGMGVSTSQIRKVLEKTQKMREFNKDEFYSLLPLLAYSAGKEKGHQKKEGLEFFYDLFDKCAPLLTEENFKYFADFFEAIVAYHKFYEKKRNN